MGKFNSNTLVYVFGIPVLIIFSCLGWIYYSFYKNVKEVKDSVLRPPFEHAPLIPPLFSNDYVSTWGAFGDFIGGTLNPIVGLLSVILLFATWWVTKQTLETTKIELAHSTDAFKESAKAQKEIQKTQSIQQFDTIFFSMMSNLNNVHMELIKKNDANKESEINKCYRQCFGETEYDLLERQSFIDDSHELRKYFIILYQIIKNIKNNIHSNSNFTEKEKSKFSRLYANMLRSNLDNKILQLLLLNIYKRFDKYSELIRDFRLFEHMDFRSVEEKNYWNFVLLQVAVEQGQQYFYSSGWYAELKNNLVLKNIFIWDGDFYTKNLFSKKYLANYLDRQIKIYYTNSIVNIVFQTDSINRNNLRVSFKQDGNRNLSSEIDIFRDKFLLRKDALYYQLAVDKKEIKILTSEHKLKNYMPISYLKVEII